MLYQRRVAFEGLHIERFELLARERRSLPDILNELAPTGSGE
uniref:Uncharacterized protein n=1 Tax=Pseudomonas syringae pv. actinidiae TaxID=103796 RepID=A0A2P0QID5_PSESF|nr:hypothetical protein [Pseudomonas syringae pv. actinidiae]